MKFRFLYNLFIHSSNKVPASTILSPCEATSLQVSVSRGVAPSLFAYTMDNSVVCQLSLTINHLLLWILDDLSGLAHCYFPPRDQDEADFLFSFPVALICSLPQCYFVHGYWAFSLSLCDRSWNMRWSHIEIQERMTLLLFFWSCREGEADQVEHEQQQNWDSDSPLPASRPHSVVSPVWLTWQIWQR